MRKLHLGKKFIYRTILLLLSVFLVDMNTSTAQVLIPQNDGTKNVILLNGIWKFKYIPSINIKDDSIFFKSDFNIGTWSNIKVPGNWELQGFAEPMYGGALKEGTGLYRTTFKVSPGWQNSLIYLAFDGVQYGYELWVNGKYAGSFASSFNRQTFDITKLIKLGVDNILAVKVSTRSKGWDFDTNDDWSLSGIIRDVTLFTLPQTHIKDVVVKTFVENKTTSSISISTLVEKETFVKFGKNLKITGKLTDIQGKLIKEISMPGSFIQNTDIVSLSGIMKIDNANLWTAETPYLYNLIVILSEDNNELQKQSLKIGIRQVTIENGILKLNGTPVKLRGVDHHDLSPVNGKAITVKEIREDLILIKRANINFIRTSHYPPHHRLIELCDSMGIYVMDEVPFGFGDKNLLDSTYLPVLFNRARATIWRDKNNPSVIVWSVGNENKITETGLKTGEYVKKLDSTRPYCFPTVGSYFSTIKDNYPKLVDILAPHYPNPDVLVEYADMFDRPMIISEYAHALGLDFDRMEALWEIMYRSPKIAGGAVWHFFDQGILRKSDKKVDVNKFTKSVWVDSVLYYDNNDNKGADGIVYANRIPQIDYWQVRKVYSPVKALDDKISIKPGRQTIQIKNINRFDFNDLSDVLCLWELFADTTSIQKGNLKLKCSPHDTIISNIDIILPEKQAAFYYMLKLKYSDRENYQFYEKTYRLLPQSTPIISENILATKSVKPVLKNNNTIDFAKGLIKADAATGMIHVSNTSGQKLIIDGPFARAGRKPTMGSLVEAETVSNDSINIGYKMAWVPHILKNPKVTHENISSNQIRTHYNYERVASNGQFIDGEAVFTVSDSGWINVNYNFTPINANGIFLETGISFLIPLAFTEFRWIGQGPYPTYPGKKMLDEFGIYHINSSDINYQGNYSEIELAVISDQKGNGFAVFCNKTNLALEKTPEGILFSHNADLSGRYNKKVLPEKLIMAKDIKRISGEFTIVPLDNNWPSVLQHLFGKSNHAARPFKPFYHSYDQ